jgi:hypothetical protein
MVLFVVGAGLWTAGRFEQRIVRARQQLLTLDFRAPLPEYDRIETSIGFLDRVQWIADRVVHIRALRAASKYWQRDYPRLVLERDAGGAWLERDPAIMRLVANAAFRRARANMGDRGISQRLNDVLGVYAEILRRDPQFDVAFNYEFVVRTRDALTRQRSNAAPSGRERTEGGPDVTEHTIHGRQGAPQEQTDKREFKIIIPQGTDERTQQPDAGTGARKPRKG